MKKATLLLLVAACASCSKSGNDPTPTLQGTWTWSESTYVTSPKNGQPATSVTSHLKAYSEVYAFDGNGRLVITYNGNTTNNCTYTYNDPTLTIVTSFNTGTFSVSELSAHRLVWTQETEDTNNRYALTETLTR